MKVGLGRLTDITIIRDSYCSVLKNRLPILKESRCVGLTGIETLRNYLITVYLAAFGFYIRP